LPVLAVLATSIAASPVRAEDKPLPLAERPQAYDDLAACRTIADRDARLACFDKTSESFVAAVEARAIVVVGEKQVAETKRTLFGFTLPKLKIFASDDDDDKDEVSEIVSKVRSAQSAGNGEWLILLEDDALWQTTEPLAFKPKPGDTVTVRKAAFGSYFLRLNQTPKARAKRVR